MNRWLRAALVICAGDLAVFLGTGGTADHWIYAASGSAAFLLVAAGAHGQPWLRLADVALAVVCGVLAIHAYVPPGTVNMDFAPSPVVAHHARPAGVSR